MTDELLRERYEVLGAIGHGGQGEVYKALDLLHGRHVAVKVRPLPPGVELDAVIAEGRALFTMTPHANLAIVREDLVAADRYVLVMDWVDGPTLAERLAEGPLAYDEAVGILTVLAEALDHLHTHQPEIVHGDVKPANVILSPRGPVLVDFGLAGAGLGFGTADYSAPEVASRGADRASDIYGLAATAHALLEGRPPSAGESPALVTVPDANRARVLEALRKGLAYDPQRRPSSARDLVEGIAPAATPTNLHAPVSGFVGREAAMAELTALLEEARLLTLRGPAGIGKSRLAHELARTQLRRFPSGVWWIDAEANDGDVLATIGRLIAEPGRSDDATTVDHIAASVASAHVLLIIDGAERSGTPLRAPVTQLLETCENLRVIATAREALRVVGEAMWDVPPLRIPPVGAPGWTIEENEAVRLFCARARPYQLPDAGEWATIGAITRHVDGIPLAIEAAAAHVSSLGLTTVERGLRDPAKRRQLVGTTERSAPLPKGVLTFLFTDIEGSTRLATELGDAWLDVLMTHHAILRDTFTAFGGHEAGTAGDSFFVVFSSAPDAIMAAVSMQRALAEHDWTPHAPLRVRVGIHNGEAIVHQGNYVGLHVHTAARVESAAAGGQILATEPVLEAAGDLNRIGVDTLDLGLHRLKDLPAELRLFQITADGIDRDFPPLKTQDALRNNVPLPQSTFIGRAEQLTRLHRFLDSDRLLSLVGPGGAGKTRLALKLASERLHRYADGVWFVELETAHDETTVLTAVAQVLGVQEQSGVPMLDALTRHVRSLDVLVVLDNCEHVIDEAATIAEALLRSGLGVRLLVTSRESLGIAGERTWSVPPLTSEAEDVRDAEAVALLVDRIRYMDPGFVLTDDLTEAAVAIATQLDGLPLAIELAAASAAELSVPEVARQLDRRFELLTRGSRTARDRQRTLWGAIDWSYGLLDDETRSMFRLLGVFAADFDVESAAGISEHSPESVTESLRRLTQKTLVAPTTTGRFRMLESIRAYSRERAAEHNEDADLRRRHARWFADGALTTGAPRWWSGSPSRLEPVKDDLSQSLQWLNIHDQRTALALLDPLLKFWAQRGRWSEGRALAQQTLDAAKSMRCDERVNALALTGQLALWQGDHAGARSAFVESAETEVELHGEAHAQASFGNVGLAALVQGDLDGAEELLNRALDGALRAGQRVEAGRIRFPLAEIARLRGDLDLAWERGIAALDAARTAGDEVGELSPMLLLGAIAQRRGDLDEARRLYSDVLERTRRANNSKRTIYALYRLATVALDEDKPEAAGPLLSEALAVGRDTDARSDLAESLEATARLALALDRTLIACRLLAAADALRAQLAFNRAPADVPSYDAIVAALKERCGTERFVSSWAEGEAMTLDDAIKVALDFVGAHPTSE